MLDARLRPWKDSLARPLVAWLAPRTAPLMLTVLSLVAGVASGVAAAGGAVGWSLGLWWLSRIVDGLDGPVARARGEASDLGGYLDQLSDTVVYAAIPLGVAVASGERGTWIAGAVLLATFYMNAVSWLYLSAVLEKRRLGSDATGATTSIAMPSGLVEGTETIVLYSLLLAVPTRAVLLCWLMAALAAVTALQRLSWAWRRIR